MSAWTEEQKSEWLQWLSERPAHVRAVAEVFPPNRSYRIKDEASDLGNYYIPEQYDEHPDGTVTIVCAKYNDQFPPLGGYSVFGMKPESLEPIEP